MESANTHVLTVFTDEQRKEMLLHEMHALRTRAQPKRALESNEEPEHTIQSPISSKPAPEKAAPEPAPVATLLATPAQSANNKPSHPFSKARDAAYAPPKDRNLGLPPPAQGKLNPAYRTNAPVYREKDVYDVFESAMDAKVTVTQRQLLSIAPDVRAHMREVTTARRAPPKDNKPTAALAARLLRFDACVFAAGLAVLEEGELAGVLFMPFLDPAPQIFASDSTRNEGARREYNLSICVVLALSGFFTLKALFWWTEGFRVYDEINWNVDGIKGNSGFKIRKEFPTPSAGPSPPLRAAAWDTTGGGLDRQFDYLTV
ncbi:hypothetical protein B0H14DRAFT_3522252 [Mycena olivaceomarginata]|nr:hypothetical protein B0H14DRAFT_3522252 [Mycena olivaceomarginata]